MSNDLARAIQRATHGIWADVPNATITTEMRCGPCLVARRPPSNVEYVTEVRGDFMASGNGDSSTVAEARRSYAVQKAAEERAKATAVAQAAYPGGWLLPDGRWAYVDEEGWPRCSQYAPVDAYFVVASSPATMRWRDYRGSRLHIGGGDGYVCDAWPWEPRLEPSDSTRPVCEKCVAGGA